MLYQGLIFLCTFLAGVTVGAWLNDLTYRPNPVRTRR